MQHNLSNFLSLLHNFNIHLSIYFLQIVEVVEWYEKILKIDGF